MNEVRAVPEDVQEATCVDECARCCGGSFYPLASRIRTDQGVITGARFAHHNHNEETALGGMRIRFFAVHPSRSGHAWSPEFGIDPSLILTLCCRFTFRERRQQIKEAERRALQDTTAEGPEPSGVLQAGRST